MEPLNPFPKARLRGRLFPLFTGLVVLLVLGACGSATEDLVDAPQQMEQAPAPHSQVTEAAPPAQPAPAPVQVAPVAPAPPPPVAVAPIAPVAPQAKTAYYANCDAARAAGTAPLSTGDTGYRSGLDRDSDGLACE